MSQNNRPSTRSERKAKKPATLPARYRPKFLGDCDQRQAIVKEIKKRLKELIESTDSNSPQKQALCEEAVWLMVWMETQKAEALDSGKFDAGVYFQAINSLSGLLNKLGLERKHKKTVELADYLEASK